MGPFQFAQHNRWCSDNSTHRPSQLLSSVCPQTKWQHLCGTLHGPNNQTILESHYPPQSCTGGTTGGEIRKTRRTDRRGRRWGGRSAGGRGGSEETAERAERCRCGVRKPLVVCLPMGWRGRGLTDRMDLAGLCSFLCVSTTSGLVHLHPPTSPPILPCNATCLITSYERPPPPFF